MNFCLYFLLVIQNVNEVEKALPVKTELTELVRLLVWLVAVPPSGKRVQVA